MSAPKSFLPGVLRAAPRKGAGFSFVTLDEGGDVFVPVDAAGRSGLMAEDVGARVLVLMGAPDSQGRGRAATVIRDLSDVGGETPDPIEALILRMLSKLERSVAELQAQIVLMGGGAETEWMGGED